MEAYAVVVIFGKKPSKAISLKKQLKIVQLPICWNKLSIFFQLPYWKTLLIHHNIDVMHTKKNVCDNILNPLLDIDNKSKDNLNDD